MRIHLPKGSMTSTLPKKIIKYGISLAALAISLFLLKEQSPKLWTNDFVMFWSAARVTLTGGNPYDPGQMLSVQRQAGWEASEPILMYNPPWTIAFILPFGLFDRLFSQVLWLLTSIAIILICVDRGWVLSGGNPRLRWLAWVLALIFGPTFSALAYAGQISPLLLLGVFGFLIFINQPGREWLAGGFSVLATIKPQALLLFLIAFFLWSIYRRRWNALLGFGATLLLGIVIVMIFDPPILLQYLESLRSNPPVGWATPTIGAYLRLYTSPTSFWMQFLPPIAGAAWLVYYWLRNKDDWDWRKALPGILFASFITSAYTWTYDYLPLLLPVIEGIAWVLKPGRLLTGALAVLAYLLINYGYFRIHLYLDDFWFIWFAPVILFWYLITRRISREKVAAATAEK